jgi:hypothetical protein
MQYTTYPISSDRRVAELFVQGDWQRRLLDGIEAWDGSTIEQFVAGEVAAGRCPDLFGNSIEMRLEWTSDLIARLREVGLIVLNGPHATITTPNAAPDSPMVDEIARQHGLECLSMIFHSVDQVGAVGDVPIFKCVVTAKQCWKDWQGMIRKDRYVIGRPDVEVPGFWLDWHVCETLRTARLRAKKVNARIPEWAAEQARKQRIAEEFARELELATPAPADELFAIRKAFE